MFFLVYITVRLTVLMIEWSIRATVLAIRVMTPIVIAVVVVLATWTAAFVVLVATGVRGLWRIGVAHHANRQQVTPTTAVSLDAFGNPSS